MCRSVSFLFSYFSPWDISWGPLRKAEKRRKEEKQVLKILWAFACVPRTVLAKSLKSKFPVLENTLSVYEAKYLL